MNATPLLLSAALVSAFAGAAQARSPQTRVVPSVDPVTVVPTGSCASPTGDITASPSTGSGNTSGGANNVPGLPDTGGLCDEYAWEPNNRSGLEDIWVFTPGASNNLTFSISGANSWDPAIYILQTCGDANSCVIGTDDVGGQRTPTVTSSFTPGQTYYFYVDSYYPPSGGDEPGAGPYTLNVTGTFPVSLTEFTID